MVLKLQFGGLLFAVRCVLCLLLPLLLVFLLLLLHLISH